MIDNVRTTVVTDNKGFYKIRVKPDAVNIAVIDPVLGRVEESIDGRRPIESVDVLKGPSAAIYGARGANGVILINTRIR